MFTGIIEEIGVIENIYISENSEKIIIKCKKILEDIKLGDSICTNGVCLTVTEFKSSNFTVDIMPETRKRTSLSQLKVGSKVNLERALKASHRFGGHIVTGHIDGVGIIKTFKDDQNAIWISIEANESILKYIVEKGSIAIDGVSLTVAYVDNKIFKVSVIPHTKEQTILINKSIGHKVNLECDVIGKYVEKLLKVKEINKKTVIDMEFLMENGF
ncbi:riboflavin synthase [Clostridium rectalis]|uniref:riboflavin synthase n=1 Tax=Clostridium rectalis TaxID=2040295 RepID=UPI000F63217A|nr:riboflavin synthase [Clostridium rectalis]